MTNPPQYPPPPGPPPPGPPPPPPYGPQPMSPADERMWAMFAHLSPFLAAVVGLPFLGPLVIYLVYRDRGPFVREHSAESLNFQLTLLIGYLVSLVLIIVVVGFFLLPALFVLSIVFQILGAVAANKGESFRYPLTIKFVS